MAKYGAANFALFLVDGYSLLAARVREVADKTIAALQRTDGLGDSWDESTPTGVASHELSQTGAFYDDSTNNIHTAMVGQGAVSRVVSFSYEGNTIGKRVVMLSGAFATAYKRIASLAGLHKADVEYTCSGQKDEGVLLHALGAEVAAVTGTTSVDNGASSAAGATAHLHVTALTLGGYTSATAKVRHSADNSTFVDLITFTVVTAAPTAERKSVAGTVNRYLNSSLAFNGSGSGPSITYAVAAARG
jgi:hypothetical protein